MLNQWLLELQRLELGQHLPVDNSSFLPIESRQDTFETVHAANKKIIFMLWYA